jgi:hypothetical protein
MKILRWIAFSPIWIIVVSVLQAFYCKLFVIVWNKGYPIQDFLDTIIAVPLFGIVLMGGVVCGGISYNLVKLAPNILNQFKV